MKRFAIRAIASVAVSSAALLVAGDAAAQAKGRLSFHWGADHESAIMSTKLADEVNK